MKLFQPCLVPFEAPLDKTWVQAVPEGEVCPPLLPALLATVCSPNKEGHICVVGTSVLMKLSQQRQDCIDTRGGLLAWFYGRAFAYISLTEIINAFRVFCQLLLPLSCPCYVPIPAVIYVPQMQGAIAYIGIWFLSGCSKVLRVWPGFANIRKYKEAQCLHKGANGIEIDTVRAIKWHQTHLGICMPPLFPLTVMVA